MTRSELLQRLMRRRTRRGVTLVEVLIVVAIMALIGGGVAFMVLPEMEKTRVKTAKQNALHIRQVAISYLAIEGGGECPTIEKLVAEKKLDVAGGSKDPWGGGYTISCSADDVSVSSPGPDKAAGTEDDIVAGDAALGDG